jgi:YrbI family 3-deoxy-D-manno-octulosonate 8-phosphate phosphatase
VTTDIVVAIIPARGGSKGVPGKNLVTVGGRSLVARAIDACRRAGNIDQVFVSTDDDAIAAEAERYGASLIRRPADLATDQATSESALLHALDELGPAGDGATSPQVVVFVQCTSPFIDPHALAAAVSRVASGDVDVAFSAVPTYEFLWSVAPDDSARLAKGLNHDAAVRLRRQDRQPDWRETGAFYVMDAAGFRAAQHRFFGRVAVEPVAEADAIEIDTPEQVEVARALARARPVTATTDLSAVVALVTDFDGVHTDDRASLGEDGTESVVVSRADGHGISLLREAGIPVLILSKETNPVVGRRATKLGVDCRQGITEKLPALERWLTEHALDPALTAYVGNDVNDLSCMAAVGFPIAVADAQPIVVDHAVYVTERRGGRGAVREVADRILTRRS